MKKKLLTLVFAYISIQSVVAYERIVTIGGSITEIVYRLGGSNKIVGSDTSSVYPEAAKKTAKVGYWMRLSSEGILSLKPDLILASSQSKQPNVYAQLRDAGVKVVKIDDRPSVEGAIFKIQKIAKTIGKTRQSKIIINRIKKKAIQIKKRVAKKKSHPKILFIYARGTRTVMVGGVGSSADSMIVLTGGKNAASAVRGFKPIDPEWVIKASPDIVLMLDGGVQSLGGPKGVWSLPGVALTPAGKNKRLIQMDDLLLLGFGPRLGEALEQLHKKVHSQ